MTLGSDGRKPGGGASGGSPAPPRRVKFGVKLVCRERPEPTTWSAQRWTTLLESIIPDEALQGGLAYARSGQTTKLEIEPGEIRANVQGHGSKPYETIIRVTPFGSERWDRLITAMAGEAIYAARLLAHEMPPGMEALLDSLGMALLPLRPDAIETACTCGERTPCKHAATIGHLLTERLSSEPLLIFTLYGMPAEEVIERLRQARAIHTQGAAAAHADPMIPESQVEPQPLEACLDDFWRCGPQLAELEHAPPPQHIAHALLRRLGPSPMRGRFPMVGLLASIYDAVSAEAIRIRNQAEHIEPAAPPGE